MKKQFCGPDAQVKEWVRHDTRKYLALDLKFEVIHRKWCLSMFNRLYPRQMELMAFVDAFFITPRESHSNGSDASWWRLRFCQIERADCENHSVRIQECEILVSIG